MVLFKMSPDLQGGFLPNQDVCFVPTINAYDEGSHLFCSENMENIDNRDEDFQPLRRGASYHRTL